MTTGCRNVSGVDFDSLFDPYVQGTKPSNCGFRTSDGSDLVNRYAPISFGSKGPDVGYRTSAGVDVSNLWAAYGTANYALPINGKSYIAGGGRGTTSLVVNINSSGGYNVQQIIGSTTTLDSGTWLPAGGVVSDYSVKFSMTGFSSGPDSGGGSNSFSNGAASASSLTTSRSASCSSIASATGTSAGNGGTVVIHIYKSGVEVSTTTITFSTNASG